MTPSNLTMEIILLVNGSSTKLAGVILATSKANFKAKHLQLELNLSQSQLISVTCRKLVITRVWRPRTKCASSRLEFERYHTLSSTINTKSRSWIYVFLWNCFLSMKADFTFAKKIFLVSTMNMTNTQYIILSNSKSWYTALTYLCYYLEDR